MTTNARRVAKVKRSGRTAVAATGAGGVTTVRLTMRPEQEHDPVAKVQIEAGSDAATAWAVAAVKAEGEGGEEGRGMTQSGRTGGGAGGVAEVEAGTRTTDEEGKAGME
jgi:hypothetical protein